MKDFLYRLFGYRQLGAILSHDKRDYSADKVEKKDVEYPEGDAIKSEKEAKSLARGVFGLFYLLNVRILNQLRTNRCTAYGLTMIVSIMLTRRLKKKIWIPSSQLWGLQKKTGASEKRGDSLHNALNNLITHGLVFNDYDTTQLTQYDRIGQLIKIPASGKRVLKKVTFEGYYKVPVGKEQEWIDKGHPLYGGSKVYKGYVDDLGYWLLSGEVIGAHCWIITGYKLIAKVIEWFQMVNSWGDRWNGDGTAKVLPTEMKEVYGPYVITGLKITTL